MSHARARTRVSPLVLAAVVVVAAAGWATQADATHEPANKVSASGSRIEVFGPQTRRVLMSETVKTSKPTDLILGVSLECSITTDVTTVGSDDETAFGQVRVWVEIDGKPVPVSADDTGAGRVIFCNRTYQRTTQLGSDDTQDTVRTFLETRTANAFNWMAPNVGSATHKIEVLADLTTAATAGSSAKAAVGARTLVVEPTKSANDEAVTQLG